MGSPRACLQVSGLLKWGIFTGCALKIRIIFIQSQKDPKFYLESKASFIDISSIASFKLFLIAWLRNIALFWTVSWLARSPCLGQNTSSRRLFSKKVEMRNTILRNYL